jgi:hypothetical protein
MSATIEERLNEQLGEAEATIKELEAENEELRSRIEGDTRAWAIGQTIKDDERLPLPRLEFVWIPLTPDWGSYAVEYRLVYKHLVDNVVTLPLSRTKVSGNVYPKPWRDGAAVHLPFRDGSHAFHDAAHLRLPLYACPPGEDPIFLASEPTVTPAGSHYTHQRRIGEKHRRAEPR